MLAHLYNMKKKPEAGKANNTSYGNKQRRKTKRKKVYWKYKWSHRERKATSAYT